MFNYISIISLLISLSIDFSVAGISLGISNIKVPKKAILFLSLTNTIFLIISYILGKYIISYINSKITILPSIIFIIFGLEKILESIIKNLPHKKYKINIFNTILVLQIYNNPSKVDLDKSKTLSIKELIILALSLSLDNIIIGIGMYTFSNYLAFIIISNLLISYFLFYIANKYFINRKKNKNIDYSWLGGIIFLLIGIYRLI